MILDGTRWVLLVNHKLKRMHVAHSGTVAGHGEQVSPDLTPGQVAYARRLLLSEGFEDMSPQSDRIAYNASLDIYREAEASR